MKHILIADDQPENRYLLNALLRGYGYHTTEVADGVAALAEASTNPPDLIISDLLMPVMDGFELCRHWKADPTLRGVPFLVYTATYTQPADQALATLLGADGFLVKPLPVESLLETVAALLADGAKVAPGSVDAEAELRAHNAALTRKLEEKVRRLEADAGEREQLQAQLRAAQRLEAIGRLAVGIAHDFNNLLTVIQVYTQFVVSALPEEEVTTRRDLDEVLTAANRAATLTRQLLAFGRKQQLEPDVIDLNRLVTGIERMLRRLLGDDILIETDLSLDVPPVFADPSQIEQVLMNLALNARDAMPQGGRLRFVTRRRIMPADASNATPLSAGDYAELTVTDDGGGMAPDTLERAFEPFFTTKAVGKGTGLGLAIVHGIIHQSGGRLELRSTPGAGTSVTAVLPAASADAAALLSEAPTKVEEGGERVIIVEDEPALRQMAARILSGAGYSVETAADGGDAIRRFTQRVADFDLLVTDINMPEVNGIVLAGRLRALSPRLRVLLMSGNTPSQGALAAAGLTDAPFLGKPFTAGQLRERVRAALDALD